MADDVASIIREAARSRITCGFAEGEDCILIGSQDVLTAFDPVAHEEEIELLNERGWKHKILQP